MSIKSIERLSLNPHFYALLMQSFLSGYAKPCDIKLPFMAITLLFYDDLRNKLMKANKNSRIESLFADFEMYDQYKFSGKSRTTDFVERYYFLKQYCKEAIIILSSEHTINFHYRYITCNQPIRYQDYMGNVKTWLKSAYYLGVIFAKTNSDRLSFYLGVDTE